VWWRLGAAVAGLLAVAIPVERTIAQQPARGRVTIRPATVSELRDWAPRIDSLRRSGELRLRVRRDDLVVPGRIHERYDQFHRGVRVVGADVAEQLNRGQMVSAFGNVYEGIDVETTPSIEADVARAAVEARAGVEIGRVPELVILPRGEGADVAFLLAWRVRAATAGDVREYFVDARDGSIAWDYSDMKTQSAVGRGQGVLGDTKKISVSSSGGQFVATDRLRPPAINTYDMRGDYQRTIRYLNEIIQLTANDLAADSDNTWTDGANVDAHVYAGYTYDYYFKRFGRRGLDNNNLALINIVHPARRQDFLQNFPLVPDFSLNAGYYGDGLMVYGEGLPAGFTAGGQTVDYFSGALDIVSHELTHGVTQYTSNLIYLNESGALNEAFSDIMSTAVEFFFQPAGNGALRADYLEGEDVFRPGGIRSLADPQAYGDPDHYSRRFTGTADNGGVHINSGIPNHVFYLAIEGGTNRTSGLSVQGVGGANREQIERVFYRAFTQMLPANATFSVARAATLQSARDLFGANSAAERALTQAWTAVGVN
jgi:Zn-dependent metalloprotease